MRRDLIPFAVTFALAALGTNAAWAQCPTIVDALEAVAPGVTLKVVRDVSLGDNPGYCTSSNVNCITNTPTFNRTLPWECAAQYGSLPAPGFALAIGVDAAGNTYDLAPPGKLCFPLGHSGYVLERISPSGTSEVVARISTEVIISGLTIHFSFGGSFQFDSTNGRILIPFTYDPSGIFLCPYQHYGLAEFGGLPKLFDTFLTFLPAGQSLTALTPGLPDGFPSADSLQAWTGDVRTLPDWSKASSLVCTAAASPAPGQLVGMSDTLPDPEVGQARYYVVASQSGTQRRLGRQYVNGAFSARDPGTLPVCQ
jgi:hypothetical protein